MRRSLYDVEIDGTNISTTLAPILISISIKRKRGAEPTLLRVAC